MPSGGHARSGPTKDPNSLRSAASGFKLLELPAEKYDGPVPKFPLPDSTLHERDFWKTLWTYSQAHQWAKEEWRWHKVAMYVRTFVRCAADNAKTADVNALPRLADDIGMSAAGLKLNGWKIAAQTEVKPEQMPATGNVVSMRDRARKVTDGGA
jgi:hypothetical protein